MSISADKIFNKHMTATQRREADLCTKEMKQALLRRGLIEGEESGEVDYSLKKLIPALDHESSV